MPHYRKSVAYRPRRRIVPKKVRRQVALVGAVAQQGALGGDYEVHRDALRRSVKGVATRFLNQANDPPAWVYEFIWVSPEREARFHEQQ